MPTQTRNRPAAATEPTPQCPPFAGAAGHAGPVRCGGRRHAASGDPRANRGRRSLRSPPSLVARTRCPCRGEACAGTQSPDRRGSRLPKGQVSAPWRAPARRGPARGAPSRPSGLRRSQRRRSVRPLRPRAVAGQRADAAGRAACPVLPRQCAAGAAASSAGRAASRPAGPGERGAERGAAGASAAGRTTSPAARAAVARVEAGAVDERHARVRAARASRATIAAPAAVAPPRAPARAAWSGSRRSSRPDG